MATLTFGDVEPKLVTLKTYKRVKEDYMLKDPTGLAVVLILDPNVSKLRSQVMESQDAMVLVAQ